MVFVLCSKVVVIIVKFKMLILFMVLIMENIWVYLGGIFFKVGGW